MLPDEVAHCDLLVLLTSMSCSHLILWIAVLHRLFRSMQLPLNWFRHLELHQVLEGPLGLHFQVEVLHRLVQVRLHFEDLGMQVSVDDG